MKTISIHKLTLFSLLLACFAGCSDEEESRGLIDNMPMLTPSACRYYDNPGYFEAEVLETDTDWTHVLITRTPEGENFKNWKPKKMKFETYQINQSISKGMTVKFVLLGRQYYYDLDRIPDEDIGIIKPYTGVNQDKSKWAAHPFTGLYTGLVLYSPGSPRALIILETYEGRRLKGEYGLAISPVTEDVAAFQGGGRPRFRIVQSKQNPTLDYPHEVFYWDAKIQIE